MSDSQKHGTADINEEVKSVLVSEKWVPESDDVCNKHFQLLLVIKNPSNHKADVGREKV